MFLTTVPSLQLPLSFFLTMTLSFIKEDKKLFPTGELCTKAPSISVLVLTWWKGQGQLQKQ